MEWGLRWLEREAPQTERLVLVHSDYRTGNFLVGEGGLHGRARLGVHALG